MLNTKYLDLLAQVENKYGVELEDGEKVVFTAVMITFGTEKGLNLGLDAHFTMTNKRVIANNGSGEWSASFAEDIVSIKKVEYGKFIFKSDYIAVDLNTTIVFNNGKMKMTGFQFYFKKQDKPQIEEIVNNLNSQQ